MNHDVFISYSSKEKAVADGVCHYLEDHDVKCWMAPRDIPAGTDYAAHINDAIKSCRAVVLVFSQLSSASRWVYSEINIAFSAGKPIAPFRIDNAKLEGGLELMLNQMHIIDAYPNYSDRLSELFASICRTIGQEKNIGVHNELSEDELYSRKGYIVIGTGESVLTKEYVQRCNIDGKKIKVSSSVHEIQPWTFNYTSPSSIILPEGISIIPDASFLGCKMKYILIPESVRIIEEFAFKECKNLSSLVLPQGIKYIGEAAFLGCGLTSLNIPQNVTGIQKSSFAYCKSLVSLDIPNNVTYISSHAFEHCNSLISIVIPPSVQNIGPRAFGDCNNLKTVVLLNPDTNFYTPSNSAPSRYFDNGKIIVVSNFSFPKDAKIIKG